MCCRAFVQETHAKVLNPWVFFCKRCHAELYDGLYLMLTISDYNSIFVVMKRCHLYLLLQITIVYNTKYIHFCF